MQKGIIMVTFNAPDTQEFLNWAHTVHMKDMNKVPGVYRIRRYEIVDGPADKRRYLAVIETEDVEASMAYRKTPDGLKPQQDSNSRGVSDRYTLTCREIFDTTFAQPGAGIGVPEAKSGEP
ncbi:MAG: hypothetical protein WDO68_32480 [Gammaproteobacteria bacterium]